MKNIRKIAEWLKSKYKYYTTPKFDFVIVEDVPDLITEGKVFIISENNHPEMIIFKCPCGCKKDIHLNLLKDAKPRWSYTINNKGNINLSPSIWRKVGCKSHFILHNGRINWI